MDIGKPEEVIEIPEPVAVPDSMPEPVAEPIPAPAEPVPV